MTSQRAGSRSGRGIRYAVYGALVGLSSVLTCPVEAELITGISIPVNGSDAISHPFNDQVWSVGSPPYPLNTHLGIGFLVNTAPLTLGGGSDFGLHDHVYIAPNIPDPNVAVVTYRFDTPAIVKGVRIFQHANGISKIEGFYGSTPGALTSLGSVFGPSGDITGSAVFTDGQPQTFEFGNTTNAGTLFQFIVRKTSLDVGWASYRVFPLDINGTAFEVASAPSTPEPGTWAILGALSVVGASFLRRRR